MDLHRTVLGVVAVLAVVAGIAAVFRRKMELRRPVAAGVEPRDAPAADPPQEQLEGQAATRDAFDQALAKLAGGDSATAIELMLAAVRRVEEQGADSPAHAAALMHLGLVFRHAGDYVQAARAVESAAAIPPRDERARRDRLTYLTTLGELLTGCDDYPRAEEVLREALAGREALDGKRHVRCANALKALAELLLLQGRAEDAVPLITRATEIYIGDQAPQAAEALAMQAFIFEAASRKTGPTWRAIDALGPARKLAAFGAIAGRVGFYRGSYVPYVLEELLGRVEPPRQGSEAFYWGVASAAIRAAQTEEDVATWLRVSDTLIEQAAGEGNASGARARLMDLWQNRAMALEQGGRIDLATDGHQKALAIADRSGAPRLLARCHRNLGLLLAEQTHDGAEEYLRTAVANARQPDGAPELGESLAAYGIFLQHRVTWRGPALCSRRQSRSHNRATPIP